MSNEEIICVGCPMGCQVRLTVDPSGEISETAGNECKKGRKYVEEEYKNPVRVFTATVLTTVTSRPLLPVRTNVAIPKDKLKECARAIAEIVLEPPMAIEQVIISDLLGTGADLICSADLPA